jgi:uncharacterized repeat protein (TIGR01451 family)
MTLVVTAPAQPGTVYNHVEVFGNDWDDTPSNNSDDEQTEVYPYFTDLAVTKTDSPDPVKIGQNITYTITVTNNGPDRATGVYAVDNIGAAYVARL